MENKTSEERPGQSEKNKKNTLWAVIFIALTMILIAAIGAVYRFRHTNGQVTVSFAGDIMLSRGVEKYLKEYGYDYPYEAVRSLFLKDDLTVGNLECPITDSRNAADKTKRFVFKADKENGPALKRAGFDCLNLANNHSMDYLSGGLLDTFKILEQSGLSYVGASRQDFSSYVFEKNGVKIGILAYSAFPPEGFFYNENRPSIRYVSAMDLSGMKKDIASMRSKPGCDFTVVYFHWGVEYQPYKSRKQELIAREAIDAGADFIVGAHPHVVQGSEVYKGKYIYYSLGNFVFDRQIPPGTDEGLVLQITVGKKGLINVREIPVKITKSKPVIITSG